jgi:geranylgeranyl diphosphate synthase, type I
MAQLTPSLDDLRVAVDVELETFLLGRVRGLPENEPLIRELLRFIHAGGKRLRPAFCYWGFRAAGGSHGDAIVRACASLELLHSFALVHDDIMDASDERRGQPSVHGLHGVEVALLIGDLALVLADACLFGSGFERDRMMDAFDSYSVMRQEVIAGQYLDLRATSRETIDQAQARHIAVLKSGRYSVEKPLVIGAKLGRGSRELMDCLSRFGEPLGEAFQFRDDLLGTFGERSSLGKPTDSDIREGKRNLLYALAVEGLEGDDRAFLVQQWGRGGGLSSREVERLRDLVERSGARSATEGLIAKLASKAMASLDAAPIEATARAALEELARLVTTRSM